LYFARHGILWKASLSEFADAKTFSDFKKWFINFVEEKVWQRNDLFPDLDSQISVSKKKNLSAKKIKNVV
jgi:hypothetical protein